MLSQSVSWAKKRDMESQDELYSFFCDRLGGGGHISVMRRGREVEAGPFFCFFFYKRFLTRQVNAQFHSHFKLQK